MVRSGRLLSYDSLDLFLYIRLGCNWHAKRSLRFSAHGLPHIHAKTMDPFHR